MVEQSYSTVFKKLQKQAAGDFGDDTMDAAARATGQARAPIGYGVFAQGLAGALQAGAQDPAFGAADKYALAEYADQERATLGQTSKEQMQYDLFKTLLEHPELAKDPRAITHVNDQYGLFNPVTAMADAAIARNSDIAARDKTVSEGFEAARKAGITPTEDLIGDAYANPITGVPESRYNLFAGNITPDEQSDRITANAAATRAEADMIDAKNPNKYNRKTGGSGSGDGVQSSIIVPIPGVGMATFKGKNQANVMTAAQNARGGGNQESSRLTALKKAASDRGFTVQPRAGGGATFSNGRSSLSYDANGNRVK